MNRPLRSRLSGCRQVRSGLAVVAGALLLCACHTTTPRERALVMLSRGQYNEGVVELEKLRDADRNDPRAWIDLGHGYELQRRYDDALAAYDSAARVAPKDPRGPREGGLRCAKWGEHAAARPRLEEAIRRGDDEPSTFHALGLVCLQLKDSKCARDAYTAGLKTPRGRDDATCVLGLATLAVVSDDPAEALVWYDELIARRPNAADAYLGRAWALARLKRFDEADAAIAAAVSHGAGGEDVAKMRAFVAKLRSVPGT